MAWASTCEVRKEKGFSPDLKLRLTNSSEANFVFKPTTYTTSHIFEAFSPISRCARSVKPPSSSMSPITAILRRAGNEPSAASATSSELGELLYVSSRIRLPRIPSRRRRRPLGGAYCPNAEAMSTRCMPRMLPTAHAAPARYAPSVAMTPSSRNGTMLPLCWILHAMPSGTDPAPGTAEHAFAGGGPAPACAENPYVTRVAFVFPFMDCHDATSALYTTCPRGET